MTIKKIALIMDSRKRVFRYTCLAGLLKRIQREEDINLYIFRSAGTWSLDLNYNIGEYNIYRLPNLADFDGIILDLDNIHQRDRYGSAAAACEYIIYSAKILKKPVISVANKIDGCYYAGIDNYASMRSIMAHVYEVHQCRKFWFVMGPDNHYENQLRERAIRDYLKEHGEACDKDDRFYNESFEGRGGYHGFVKLLEKHGELPDAIVCANDNIAVGVCDAAEENGFRIPEDFILTGFDNFEKASYFSPRITTVDQKQEEIGDACVDLFRRIWQGEQVERNHYTATESIFWDSCGCRSAVQNNPAAYARQAILEEIGQAEYETEFKMLEYELMHCRNVNQMYEIILKGIPSIKCEEMYLALDERFGDFENKSGLSEYKDKYLAGSDKGGELKFNVHGYPKNMNVIGIRRDTGEIRRREEKITGLFPMFETGQGGSNYLFMPLHFSEYTVGYLTLVNVRNAIEHQYLDKLMSTIMLAMENLHKNQKLEYINGELAERSVRDAMTGFYNRLGYQYVACRVFEEYKEKKENLTVLFFDMDRLKYMNDTFGHECGDLAIRTIAATILRYCPEGAVPVRMGGDEFLLVMQSMSGEEVLQIVQTIRTELSRQSEELRLPCPLSVSIGCVDTDMYSDKNLDAYVREADAVMYEEKVQGKKNRT